MKNLIIMITALSLVTLSSPAFSAEDHSGHGAASSSKAVAKQPGAFTHKVVVDDIRAEFQIMSLKNMGIKAPDGATHHIMLRLFHDKMDHQIKKATGKIKVISPSGEEQTATLKDYSGIFAANFSFSDKGKYGVICVFKEDGKKHVVKFWYHHG